MGSVVAAPGLWSSGPRAVARSLAALVCGVLPAQPSSHVSCTGRQVLNRRATRDAPSLQLLAQQTALAPYAFNHCVCLSSFVDTHSSKLTRHPVPGACAWGRSLWSFGGPRRTGFYLPPPPHGTSPSYDPAILLLGVCLSPLRLL